MEPAAKRLPQQRSSSGGVELPSIAIGPGLPLTNNACKHRAEHAMRAVSLCPGSPSTHPAQSVFVGSSPSRRNHSAGVRCERHPDNRNGSEDHHRGVRDASEPGAHPVNAVTRTATTTLSAANNTLPAASGASAPLTLCARRVPRTTKRSSGCHRQSFRNRRTRSTVRTAFGPAGRYCRAAGAVSSFM